MNRPMQTLVTIAVVGLALWIARCSGEQAGRAAARLEAEVRQTDSSARATDSLRVEYAHRESVAVGEIRRLAAREAALRARLRVGGKPTVDVATGPDTSTRGGDSADVSVGGLPLQDGGKVAPDPRDSLIENLTAQRDLYKNLYVERGTLIERLTIERDQYRAQREAFRRQAEPGIFEQARRSLPYVLVGVLAWELARE